MSFIDTHCHIHEADYSIDAEEVYTRALDVGVDRIICVGTDMDSSVRAVEFADRHEHASASIGLHPHEASVSGEANIWDEFEKMRAIGLAKPEKLVAIGECGLDYFYHKEKEERSLQQKLLRAHIELAIALGLPIIFHVRDAFDDFWPIFEEYQGIRGVLHSFTDSRRNMEEAVEKGLYIGVNGISTFTKIDAQKDMYASVPLHRLLLETDAPYLTPVPKRGTVNEPAYVTHVASYLAALHSISLEELAGATTYNATKLFSLTQDKQ